MSGIAGRDPMRVIDLTIERPAAGGRMLARHDGVVVLVAGAIPGERVRARVERSTKNLIWATVVDVVQASSSRRPVDVDPACGGSDYLHIDYPAQCAIKSDIVVDAFRRIGKMSIEAVDVAPSPEHGYRLRARLHVVEGRAGFFLEGTHTLCDASPTRQLSEGAVEAVHDTLGRLGASAAGCASVVVSENVRATDRVLHLEPHEGAGRAIRATALQSGFAEPTAGVHVTGVTIANGSGGIRVLAGRATVSDRADELLGVDSPVPPDTTWTRHAASFFQGNRFVTGALLGHVLATVDGGATLDLYAGAGLFAVAFAARGDRVTAVEGDRTSGQDLDFNAVPYRSRLHVVRSSVEDALPRLAHEPFETVVVDPPRTGMSPEALDAVVAFRRPSLVYVSCDPATLARDAQKLVASGYRIDSIRAFDLFPNTAHVETVAAFVRKDR